MLDKLYSKKIKVRLQDGREIAVAYKTRAEDVIKMLETSDKLDNIMAVRINNEVRTIDHEIVEDSMLEYIEYGCSDSHRVYVKTAKFILYMALCRTYPNLSVEYMNNIDTDVYFICKDEEFTEDMAKNIKEEMNKIIANNSDIVRKVVPVEEAKVLYEAMGNKERLDLIKVELRNNVTLFFCEDICNTMGGVLAPTTRFIKNFDIVPFRKGFVLRLPCKNDINIIPETIDDNKLYDKYEKYNEYNDVIEVAKVSELNDKVINKDMGGVIRASETLHEKQILELVNMIDERKEVKMLLIAGPSSSGKTTFAQKLGDNLRLIGYNPIIISMDNYYKEREENYNKETGEYDFESVTSLDVDLFNKQMSDLSEGKEVDLPRYDFGKGQKVYENNKLKLKEKDILIVEGIHALNDEMTKQVDKKYKFKIYMAPITTLNVDSYVKVSSTDTRMLRRIVRDYNTRKVGVEETLEMWEKIRKGEENNIYPFVDTSDYIFNSSLVYEMGVIKTFAEPLLLQVKKTSKYFSEARRLYEFLNNFLPIETKDIPVNSLLREFIGDGSFSR